MLDIISAIWLQDFDALLELNSLHVLLLLLGIVLFLESSFVFLPLPGDGLVLFVGGMIGLGLIEFSSALWLLTSAAFFGSIVAYVQGRWLHNTQFMRKAERTLPDESLPKAKTLLNRFGFLSLFVSRFVPFVRVLTPMLMGIAQLSAIRTLIVSFTSSITWVFSLLLIGKWIMRHPFVSQYQELITKWFLISSLLLMVTAFVALFIRLTTKKRQPQTSE
ncbi:DedA family protein [Vibrio neonatus]|uniref:DedA family protein n=1 Tax=Vibrio neonatus TaxID=278860 RepID=UPI0021C41590|nr:DedA family protein [Vibrio neonatus]